LFFFFFFFFTQTTPPENADALHRLLSFLSSSLLLPPPSNAPGRPLVRSTLDVDDCRHRAVALAAALTGAGERECEAALARATAGAREWDRLA
jgi:hypothetical protein